MYMYNIMYPQYNGVLTEGLGEEQGTGWEGLVVNLVLEQVCAFVQHDVVLHYVAASCSFVQNNVCTVPTLYRLVLEQG
jgi:hypothetical protein